LKGQEEIMNHSFDVDNAIAYGVCEAIFIENLKFWILKNAANKKHYHDGYYWTYNSLSAFVELFPYWSVSQIRRIIDKLEKEGVILSGNFNLNTYDRTQWHTLKQQIHLSKTANGSVENSKSLISTDINTYTEKSPTPDGFDSFWSSYPKKTAKPAAMKAWKKVLKSEFNAILEDIGKRKESKDWKKDKGQFIPNPATYINQRRWEDHPDHEDQAKTENGVLKGAI
jgi:hypothetical protein